MFSLRENDVLETARSVAIIFHSPFTIFNSPVGGQGNAKVINSSDYPVLIRIFKQPNAPARVCGTCALGFPGAPGAFGPFRETNESDRIKLREAMQGITGVGYEALLTSTQVVSQGVTLMFIGTQTLLDASGDKFPVLFKIYTPFRSNPIFTGSQKACELV
jgi:hypothetical protein